MPADDVPNSIARARFHVLRFEEIVARQERIVRELQGSGGVAKTAEDLLDTMRYALELSRIDLADRETRLGIRSHA